MCRPGVTDLRLVRFVKRWLRGDRRRTVSESGNRPRCCSSALADGVPGSTTTAASDFDGERTSRLADRVTASDDGQTNRVTATERRNCVDHRKCHHSAATRSPGVTVSDVHEVTAAPRKSCVRTESDRDSPFICCCRSRCTSLIVDDCLGGGPEARHMDDDDDRRQLTLASTESTTSTMETYCYCEDSRSSCSADHERGCVCSCHDDALAIVRKRSKSSMCCQAIHHQTKDYCRLDACTSAFDVQSSPKTGSALSATSPASIVNRAAPSTSSMSPGPDGSLSRVPAATACSGPPRLSGSIVDQRRPSSLHRYPPSIPLSADGEESRHRSSPLTSVLRPDRRDCVGPPPNRVAPPPSF